MASTRLNYAYTRCTGANAGAFCYTGQCVACVPTGDECCTGSCMANPNGQTGSFICACSPAGIGTCSSAANCCNTCCSTGGFCADFSEDLNNCGAGGVQVPAGGICDHGNPTGTLGFHADDGHCCALGESNCGSCCANLSSAPQLGNYGCHRDIGHPLCTSGRCCTLAGTDCYVWAVPDRTARRGEPWGHRATSGLRPDAGGAASRENPPDSGGLIGRNGATSPCRRTGVLPPRTPRAGIAPAGALCVGMQSHR